MTSTAKIIIKVAGMTHILASASGLQFYLVEWAIALHGMYESALIYFILF